MPLLLSWEVILLIKSCGAVNHCITEAEATISNVPGNDSCSASPGRYCHDWFEKHAATFIMHSSQRSFTIHSCEVQNVLSCWVNPPVPQPISRIRLKEDRPVCCSN